MRIVLAAALSLCLAAPAIAADVGEVEEYEVPAAVEVRDIVFDLGGGVLLQPAFPSSKEYRFAPLPFFGLKFLRLPMIGEVVSGRVTQFTLYPSFNTVGERNSSDAQYLTGIPDTDFSIEIGPGAAFRHGPFRAFAELRYGITGHNGFVGQIGADYIANPIAPLEVSFGPRMGFADGQYMDTYFGVPTSATQLNAYDADGGIKDVGLGLEATWAFNEKIRLTGGVEYRKYVGDAADSPIVKAGNDQDLRFGLGLTYRFGFDLFKN